MDDQLRLGLDRVLLLGRQGAGKSLVGRLLARRLAADFFSMGELLRAVAGSNAELADTIGLLIDAGAGVPPELSYRLLGERLADREHDRGLILDGVPRMANELSRVRKLLSGEPTAVVVLEVPTPMAVDRLLTRSVCEGCGWPHGPGWPPRGSKCSQCGAPVSARADDTVEGIELRHEVWGREARDIVRHYDDLGLVHPIRADGPPRDVVQAVFDALTEGAR